MVKDNLKWFFEDLKDMGESVMMIIIWTMFASLGTLVLNPFEVNLSNILSSVLYPSEIYTHLALIIVLWVAVCVTILLYIRDDTTWRAFHKLQMKTLKAGELVEEDVMEEYP